MSLTITDPTHGVKRKSAAAVSLDAGGSSSRDGDCDFVKAPEFLDNCARAALVASVKAADVPQDLAAAILPDAIAALLRLHAEFEKISPALGGREIEDRFTDLASSLMEQFAAMLTLTVAQIAGREEYVLRSVLTTVLARIGARNLLLQGGAASGSDTEERRGLIACIVDHFEAAFLAEAPLPSTTMAREEWTIAAGAAFSRARQVVQAELLEWVSTARAALLTDPATPVQSPEAFSRERARRHLGRCVDRTDRELARVRCAGAREHATNTSRLHHALRATEGGRRRPSCVPRQNCGARSPDAGGDGSDPDPFTRRHCALFADCPLAPASIAVSAALAPFSLRLQARRAEGRR